MPNGVAEGYASDPDQSPAKKNKHKRTLICILRIPKDATEQDQNITGTSGQDVEMPDVTSQEEVEHESTANEPQTPADRVAVQPETLPSPPDSDLVDSTPEDATYADEPEAGTKKPRKTQPPKQKSEGGGTAKQQKAAKDPDPTRDMPEAYGEPPVWAEVYLRTGHQPCALSDVISRAVKISVRRCRTTAPG